MVIRSGYGKAGGSVSVMKKMVMLLLGGKDSGLVQCAGRPNAGRLCKLLWIIGRFGTQANLRKPLWFGLD